MYLSRLLQFGGIVLAGVGLMYGIAKNDLTYELVFTVAGMLMFFIGRSMRRP